MEARDLNDGIVKKIMITMVKLAINRSNSWTTKNKNKKVDEEAARNYVKMRQNCPCIEAIFSILFSPNWTDWFLVELGRKCFNPTKIPPIFPLNQATQKFIFFPILPFFHSSLNHSNQIDS